jgi:SAM-dependent methyltransferase
MRKDVLVGWVRADIDTERPSPARIYNFLLGGSHNLPVDRDVARRVLSGHPLLREEARANRAFLGRVVRMMVAQGIRQFLDIGCGIPAPGHPLDVARAAGADARVVHVDIDAVVVAHTRAVFHGEPAVDAVLADLADPDEIIGSEPVERLINFAEPVGLLMLAVLHSVPDSRNPHAAVARLCDTVAPGSFLAVSHLTPTVGFPPATRVVHRPVAQVGRFFDGVQLRPPGLVPPARWRADPSVPLQPGPDEHPRVALSLAAVGWKPPA